jgi:hypothetical protein
MNTKTIAWAAAGILTAAMLVGTTGRLRAQDAGDGTAGAQARAIEGVWEAVATIRDCNAPDVEFFSFLSMDSYIRGGSYIGESASEPAARATGMGKWRHEGGRDYTAVYQFFTFDAGGKSNGRLVVSAQIRLSVDGLSFRSSDTAVITDLDGTVVDQICGTRQAVRFQ